MIEKIISQQDRLMPVSVICDFDGTITSVDTTDAILNQFAPPEWEDVEQEWLEGSISSRECMSQQIGMLSVDKNTLDKFIGQLLLTRGFQSFAAYAKNAGIDLTIVSDGLDYVINHMLSHYGIPGLPVIANNLQVKEHGYQLHFPHKSESCGQGVCKCSVAAKGGEKIVVLIGDGRSDFCLAEKADLVLARENSSLEKYCLEKGLSFVSFHDFYEVAEIFEQFYSASMMKQSDILNFAKYRQSVGTTMQEVVNE